MISNTAARDQLVVFLNSRLVVQPEGAPPYLGTQTPTAVGFRVLGGDLTWYREANDFAAALLDDAGFLALQLGTWLNSPDGNLIADAVGRVLPPIYRQEYHLVVEGLKIAAGHQRQAGVQRAVGAGVLGALGLLLWALRDR